MAGGSCQASGDSPTQDEGRLSAPFGCAQGPRSLREGSTAERGRPGSSRRAGLGREDEREVRNAHSQTQIESNRVSAYPAHTEKLTAGVLRAGCLLLREYEGTRVTSAREGPGGETRSLREPRRRRTAALEGSGVSHAQAQ